MEDCSACNGTGQTETIADYNSNWYGQKKESIKQQCYKCGGSGKARAFQESSNQQQIANRSRDLDDGIEK